MDRSKVENYYKNIQEKIERKELDVAALEIRHTIEAILLEYVDKFLPAYTYDDTFNKINQLEKEGIISKQSANIFHELRQLGNKAAHHNDDNELDEKELQRALAPLRRIIDEFYEAMESVSTVAGQGAADYNMKNEKIEKLYTLATKLYMDKNYREAAKCYHEILTIDEMDGEAAFGVVYCNAWADNNLSRAAQSVGECLPRVFYMINEKYRGDAATISGMIESVAQRVIHIEGLVAEAAWENYNSIPLRMRGVNNMIQLGAERASAAYALYYLGNILEERYSQDEYLMKKAITAWKKGIDIHTESLKNQSDDTTHKRDINIIETKIRKYDSSYVKPTASACYIATAVYGSYDCPQVWTLRRYRDYKLSKTWCGKKFIQVYYAISPKLIKYVGHTQIFKTVWRKQLDNMVERLQKMGYESTPYDDRKW